MEGNSGKITKTTKAEKAGAASMLSGQRFWALTGQVGVLVTVVLGMFNLADRVQSSKVTAAVDILDYAIHPELEREIERRFDPADLKLMIDGWRKFGATSEQIILDLESSIRDGTRRSWNTFSLFALQLESQHVILVQVTNHSDQLVEDVRISLPDEGEAVVLPYLVDKKPIRWEHEIPLGTIRPDTTITLVVWSRRIFMQHKPEELHAAVTYKGGAATVGGSVKIFRRFYGSAADVFALLFDLPSWIRWTMTSVGVFVVFVLGMLVRRWIRKPGTPANSELLN